MVRPKEILNVSGCRAATFSVCHLALTPIMDTARARYSGASQKLDIGTTFSGAAYALLDPGKIPQTRSVTRRALPPTLIL